jgi:hypothetical protein
MGFWKVKGLQAIGGIGHLFAMNTGGAFPLFENLEVYTNPLAVPTNVATCDLVTSVAAGVGDTVLTMVAGVKATLSTIPRNVVIAADAAQTENCNIVGFDQFGNAQTETIVFNGAAVVAGTKVWGSLTSITQMARSGAANIGCGLGSIIGTSRRITGLEIDGAVYTTANGVATSVQETTRPVKSTTAAVHGVTFNTALAVTKTYMLLYHSDEAR